jgi:RNA polymerase sigma-70 factor (ECF subfamily)
MTERETFLRNAMEAHGEAVYRLALCRLQNQTDAEDVYQDVFLRLLEQPHRDWDGEHLKAWLIRATLNRCADLGRFRLRRPVLSLEELPELAKPMDDRSARLWEAVACLPEKLRTVVHLHYAEGYKTEEIAAMLGVPAATVRTRLRRGREKLKDLLGGIDDEESVSTADGRNFRARGAQ